MALRHIQAVAEAPPTPGRIGVFLGGSIELGKAEMWQKRLVAFLETLPCAARLDIYNPRRDDWDASWPNDHNFAPFREQVDWELRYQKRADLLLYYFAADTISPVTLLELGLFQDRGPVIGVDPAYTRIGNLVVTAGHFDLDMHIGWDNFTRAVQTRLQAMAERD